jgi:tetratricopeptide (TPR) repeat protein
VEELPVLPVGPPKPGTVSTRSLPLNPLKEEQVRQIVQAAEPEGWQHPGAELAVRLSGGNPYYALEVLEAAAESREWAESATDWDPLNDDRLRKVLDVRLSGLDGDGMRLLRAIGVLDRHARPRLVADVAEVTISNAARLAEELYLRSLIVDEQERIAFTNDTMREFVYGEMSSLQRAALHLRAGQALEKEVNPAPGALATHFYHGDDWFRSFGYAMEAAQAAQAAAGHIEAAHFAGIAGHVAPGLDERRAALEIRADSLFAAGELAEAAACYGNILKVARPADPKGLTKLQLSLAATEIERCRWDEAKLALQDSLVQISKISDPDDRLLATGEYSLLALRRASQTEDDGSASLTALAVDDALNELASRSDPPAATVLTVRMAKAVQVALAGSSRGALNHLTAAAGSLSGGSCAQVGRYLTLRGVMRAWLGEWDKAEADFLAEKNVAQTKADQVRLVAAWNNLACIALERGNWALAKDRIGRAREVEATLDENSGSRLPILTNHANLFFYQGFLSQATEAYSLAGQVCKAQGNPGGELEISSCLGLIALQRGDSRKASEHWRRVNDLQTGNAIGVGIRERFKVEWFRAAMLGPSHASLADAAEREKDRDYPSHLKLLWLDTQVLDKPSTNAQEVEQLLRDYEQSWFCHVAKRWSRGSTLRG